jgi:hypothetical protein
VHAATWIAASLGLQADDAIVVSNSNKVTLRLVPCDVLARVAPVAQQILQFELDVARSLHDLGSPVAALDPRAASSVYEQDGFAVTFWTYYEPAPTQEIRPAEYAVALEQLHAGMREVELPTPHFTDRVLAAQALVASPDRTPDLADADRSFLGELLTDTEASIVGRGAPEQLLHGEPHPGNLLATRHGLRFIDFETCCRGPVEFDVAHAPEEVSEHYPGLDQDLLRQCRTLMLATVTMWRWDEEDQLPNGRQLAAEWMSHLREEGGRRRSDARLQR